MSSAEARAREAAHWQILAARARSFRWASAFLSAAQRGRVADVSLVEIDVGFRQIAGIHDGLPATKIQVNVEFEFRVRHHAVVQVQPHGHS